MRILVTDGMDKGAVAALRADGHEVVEQFYEPDQLGAALQGFDAVVVRSKTKVRANHIDEAKNGSLKLIIRGGVGVDNIAVKYAEEAGITVKNTPRASSNAVAELAIALLFSCARSISRYSEPSRSRPPVSTTVRGASKCMCIRAMVSARQAAFSRRICRATASPSWAARNTSGAQDGRVISPR